MDLTENRMAELVGVGIDDIVGDFDGEVLGDGFVEIGEFQMRIICLRVIAPWNHADAGALWVNCTSIF